jgi:hypothetical protein
MVDRHIEKMIATLGEKARHEQESLTKMLVDYKQQLEKTKGISCLKVVLRLEIDSFILETLWP